jgi:hypothetical protein
VGWLTRWWGPDGFDIFGFAALLSDHPVATFVAIFSIAAAAFSLWDWVNSPGIGRGRAGRRGVEADRSQRSRAALAMIRSGDPLFDEGVFLGRAVAAYSAVAAAKAAGDFSRARGFLSDGMHERLVREAADPGDRRAAPLRPHGARLLGFDSGVSYDAVHAAFALSDDGREDSAEIWTFLRRPGAKSLAASGPIEGACPCCGAVLAIADAAKCAHCGAWVNSGEHDWILTEVTRYPEWAYPDPAREVGGWKELRAKDPALSLEALEDRTAVIFCRWLEARSRGDSAPLRGVAGKQFVETHRLERAPAPGSEIWGVETAAFQSSTEFDHAHVQVSWRNGRRHEAHFLILARRAGVRSDPKAGLRTAHCLSCGAPPAAADEPACRYCAESFVDGWRGWVLTGIVPFGVWKRPAPAA